MMRCFIPVFLVIFSSCNACVLHRSLSLGAKDWWVCSECETTQACCELIATQIRLGDESFINSCNGTIATVPTTTASPGRGVYSLYSSGTLPKRPLLMLNESPFIIWETLYEKAWILAEKSPFGVDEQRQSHSVTSTLSKEGGMHRQWNHHLKGLSPSKPTDVLLLLFLTEDVFVDVEDMILDGSITGGRLVQIHTSEIINIELPSFNSPQHIITIELEADTEEMHVITTLHLRYLEAHPSLSTTTLQLPSPILWNQQDNARSEILMVKDVATGLSGDLWWATAVTLCCSIVGSVLLLRDLWQVCEWK